MNRLQYIKTWVYKNIDKPYRVIKGKKSTKPKAMSYNDLKRALLGCDDVVSWTVRDKNKYIRANKKRGNNG